MTPAEQASIFVRALFESTDCVESRILKDHPREEGRKLSLSEFCHARDFADKLYPKLVQANADSDRNRWDVYLAPAPRLGLEGGGYQGAGTDEDVACARSLFADWDGIIVDDARKRIDAAKLPAPTLIVASGHGVHAYWRLASAEADLSKWKAAQQALIDRTGCDRVIKNPSRVMRLPGTVNWKDSANVVSCVLVEADLERCYPNLYAVVGDIKPLEEIEEKRMRGPRMLPVNDFDRMALFSKATAQFIAFGAPEGQRNQSLFNAACDVAGNGFTLEEALSILSTGIEKCGLSFAEARQSIESAFSKPRNPTVIDDPMPDAEFSNFGPMMSSMDHKAPKPGGDAAVKTEAPPAPSPAPEKQYAPDAPKDEPKTSRRPVVANVSDSHYKDDEGKQKSVAYYIPVPVIAKGIVEATCGWPRSASGRLFAVDREDSVLPDMNAVTWFEDESGLFAWLQDSCNIRWSSSQCTDSATKKPLNPPTKRELYEFLKLKAKAYEAVEVLPHHPPIGGLYYLRCNLPKEIPTLASGMTPLMELVQKFNPETEADRALMLAAMLTPGWGGAPGKRPAFAFTSKHGRGSGKTTTANVIADVWGGAISFNPSDEWSRTVQALLSAAGMMKRAALMDNLKGRVSGQEIEKLITAPLIDGHRLYHGYAARPNVVTWFLTANTPSLSKDLAERCVVIEIGAQKHASDFATWADAHLKKWRAEILAELLSILAAPAKCSIEPQNRDRWYPWQEAILTRFPHGNDLAKLARERRKEVDADDESAEEIARVLLNLIGGRFSDVEKRRVAVKRSQLRDALLAAQVIDSSMGPKAVTSYLKDRIGSGPLAGVSEWRHSKDGRLWLWTGEHATAQTAMDFLPEEGASLRI